MELLNSYFIRRYLTGGNFGALTDFFANYLQKIEEQIQINANFNEYVEICRYYLVNDNIGKATSMPDNEQIENYLKTANAYHLKIVKLLLENIEKDQNPIALDFSKLNIEHIMPQAKSPDWKMYETVSAEIYAQKVNSLGNLTLAAKEDNTEMGNKSFAEKKQILSKTNHLNINAEILEKDNWGFEDISLRTQHMIEKILGIYPYQKANYQIKGLDPNRQIFLDSENVTARGYLHEDETVTIYQGSKFAKISNPASQRTEKLRQLLLNQEIIKYEDNYYIFKINQTFDSPSIASNILLGGNHNGWQCWKTKNDETIEKSFR